MTGGPCKMTCPTGIPWEIAMPYHSRVNPEHLRDRLRRALEEDIRGGDVTTAATVDSEQIGSAVVVCKATGVVCGLPVFEETYRLVDERVDVKPLAVDGQRTSGGERIVTVSGFISSILTGERVALNMLGWLSGVATMTCQFVERASLFGAKITDTRKTTPLWRDLEKYAVEVGGGVNHRMGLHDMVLIKENHVDAAGGLTEAVRRVRDRWGDRYSVEVETRSLEEVREAVELDVDRIMLDNFTIDELVEAVALVGGRCEVEASGGVTLETVADIARTGVDVISVGALTHSSAVMDYSMLLRFDSRGE